MTDVGDTHTHTQDSIVDPCCHECGCLAMRGRAFLRPEVAKSQRTGDMVTAPNFDRSCKCRCHDCARFIMRGAS